jgi:ATP-binding cassette subfamily F protein 2
LAEAIKAFDGGVVLVSHDYRLIDQVCALNFPHLFSISLSKLDSISLFIKVTKEIWVCDKKQVKPWKADIREYKKYLQKNLEKK